MSAVCGLCPHHCRLAEGQDGLCRARGNRGGAVVCLNYGRLTALALDPIEKKPLARFHPGSQVLSLGSFGCNLRCPFCQNHRIAAADGQCDAAEATPEALVARALELRGAGNIGLAYTYNEPLVGYEFVRDCARLAREAGLLNVLVTNGMICPQPWQELLPWLDAVNIDLKGFSADYYRWLGGDLDTVQESIVLAAGHCHVEVTTLIVPGLNDGEAAMRAQARWLAGVDRTIPLHISRFFPCWQLTDRPPTPLATIRRLGAVAREELEFVYAGNC